MTTMLSDEALLGRLVSFDSTSRNSNRPIAAFIAEYLDRPGIRIEEQPSPDGDKLNLIVHVGPEVDPDSRNGIVLSGHMDVVPAEEPDWQNDPFSLAVHEDRLVGRGAADMKGFDALAINLAAALSTTTLAHPLVLVLTYDEEVGTLGAKHFAHAWPAERALPRAAIIGEPTSLEVVRLHKGHARFEMDVKGIGAHSGYPHLGKSAIEPAGRAVTALAELRQALMEEDWPNAEHFPEVPYPALNVARIHGGSAINIIPDHCHVDLSLRILPGMAIEPMFELIRNTALAAAGDADATVTQGNLSPPLLTTEDTPLYRTLTALMRQDKTVSASYATDAGWLQECGLEPVIWGPGSIEVAHKPNEWMPRDEYRRGAQLLRSVVENYCM
ncbi:MAG: acetylornithine deacetylase [Acidobacteriota bacterium]